MGRPGPGGKDKARFALVSGGRPEMPDGWTEPDTVTAWETFWTSVASEAVTAKDHDALFRLFRLRDDVARFYRIAQEQGEMAYGSTGQPVLHPLRKQADSLLNEIRMLEDRFGLAPTSGLKLGMAAQKAHRGLGDLSDLEETS